MKKLLSLFFTTAFLAITSFQVRAQSFDGGFLVGPVTSQIDGDGYGGFHQIGFTGGFFGRIPVDAEASWQLELKYSLFGAHSDAKEVEYGANPMDIRLHYIELPVMYRYKLSEFNINGKPMDFITLEVGLSGDFRLRATQSANFESGFENPSWLFFSVTGNIGVQFDVNDRLGFNIRSMNSITPCRWRPGFGLLTFRHYYNITLQATVVYTIVHSH